MPVLDTNVLIDLMRSTRNPQYRVAASLIRELVRRGQSICTTRFNVAELWVGIELGGLRRDEIELLNDVLSAFIILDFDERAARAFAKIDAALRSLGKPSGEIDTLIASICVVNSQPLITRNVKHFERMAGLSVESY